MLEENKQYLLEINDKSCKAQLTEIMTYSASGMPNDYIFTALEGETPLIGADARFPIPEFLIGQMTITELKYDGGMYTLKEVTNTVESVFEEMRNYPIATANMDGFLKILAKLEGLELTDSQNETHNDIINERISELEELKKVCHNA